MNTKRIMQSGRLAYYRQEATAEYWDKVWTKEGINDLYTAAERSDLGYYEDISPRFLTEKGKILEAGCGQAQFVIALRVLGYDVEGVDYAAYISLGVMEYNAQGPDIFLREAYRILEPGGIGLISVPYLNLTRRIKAALGFFRGDPEGLPFFQYAYHPQEFSSYLVAQGFSVMDRI